MILIPQVDAALGCSAVRTLGDNKLCTVAPNCEVCLLLNSHAQTHPHTESTETDKNIYVVTSLGLCFGGPPLHT